MDMIINLKFTTILTVLYSRSGMALGNVLYNTTRWQTNGDTVIKIPVTRHLEDNTIIAEEDFFAGDINDILEPRVTSGADEFWELFNKIDEGKKGPIYTKVGDARPILTRYRYAFVPLWYSDEDTTDPNKLIDVNKFKSVMQYCKNYYERMSFGEFTFDESLILEQAVMPVSSANPGFGDLENFARDRLNNEGYIKGVDYDGIVISYNLAKSGPFSGHGGWGTVNEETSITWMSWEWGLSNDVARHEFGHNFGHPHHLTNKYLYRIGLEGTVGYDGYDMMSGGNHFEISDLSVASKWYFGWMQDSSIQIMTPDGSSSNCPTCVSEGTFELYPFDGNDQTKLMGIHIPITTEGSTLYSYWLSYRSGNPAKIGLSIHVGWFGNIGNGEFGAYYDSLNYDAYGDTDTTEDSFVTPGTCYHIYPSMKMLEIDPLRSIAIEPVVCVEKLSEGNSITINVSFPDLSSENEAKVKTHLRTLREVTVEDETKMECGTSIDMNIDAGKNHLLHIQNTGKKSVLDLGLCPTSGLAKAYIYDRYPYSPLALSSPGGYGAQKGLSVENPCLGSTSTEYITIHNEAYVLIEGTSGQINLEANCVVDQCQYGQKKSDGKCIPCDPTDTNCKTCPGGTYFLITTCVLSESFKEIETSKEWRVWSPSSHTKRGWVWDIMDLEFYSNTDCTGELFNDGTPIDSGNAGGGWGPENAFDSSDGSAWGGRSDEDNFFWLGMTFSKSTPVKCVSLFDSFNNGVTELRVQSWESSTKTWQNTMIVKDYKSGQRNNIALQYTNTAAPTKSPPKAPTVQTEPPTTTTAPTKVPTSNPTLSGAPSIYDGVYVESLSDISKLDKNGKKWQPIVEVTLKHNNGGDVNKVKIRSTFSTLPNEKDMKKTCVTKANGICVLKGKKLFTESSKSPPKGIDTSSFVIYELEEKKEDYKLHFHLNSLNVTLINPGKINE